MISQSEIESLSRLIRLRTENFYEAHGLCCSEAIIYVINKGVRGDLSDHAALQIGNGFCGGMGGGEGTCGALASAIASLGLFLSPHGDSGLSKKKARLAAKKLHDTFKEQLSSITCNDLTKEFQDQRKARLKNCQRITGLAAEISATILFKNRPELIKQVDQEFLAANDSKIAAFTSKICSLLKR